MKNIPFKTSFSTLGCPDLGWDDLCALSSRFGVDALEIRAMGGQMNLPAHLAERFGDPASWAKAVAAAGKRICGLSTSLKLIGGKPEDRAAFLQFIPWAEAVGGAPLRVFDGGATDTGLDAGGLEQALDTIAWWRAERAQHGWKSDIIVETHDALARSAPLIELQGALATPVDILWDTHHTWKKGGEDPAATWAAIGQWVRHVHVKDSIGKPSARHPYTYVLPGEGEFPLRETLELLRDAGFSAVVSLEWEKVWHPYLGDISEPLAAMAGFHERLRD